LKDMKKIIKLTISTIFLFGLFALPFLTSVQPASASATTQPASASATTTKPALLNRLTNIAGQGGFQTDETKASTPIIIGTIIGAFLGFLGVTFIVILIIAGFEYMRARGNDEQIHKAISSIREAIIGLVIAMASYAIWNFIFRNIIAK